MINNKKIILIVFLIIIFGYFQASILGARLYLDDLKMSFLVSLVPAGIAFSYVIVEYWLNKDKFRFDAILKTMGISFLIISQVAVFISIDSKMVRANIKSLEMSTK